jgi:hypothetical protein
MSFKEFKDAFNVDFNNVAAKVQIYVHSYTYTKYQRKNIKAYLKT